MESQLYSLSAEEKFHFQAQLLNTVEQAILAVDLAGRVVFWNHFAETFYGWKAEEAQGRNIIKILSAPSLMETIRANLGQGKAWSADFVLERRDGVKLMTHVNATLIEFEHRTVINIISFLKNENEHEQLREANRLLAEASALLIDAVDFETPLTTLAQLAVPQLADWCVVHLLQHDGSIEQVALAPAKTTEQQAARDWLQNQLPNDYDNGLPAVIRSGEPKLVTDLTSDLQAAAAAIKSYMIIPLITRPKTLGAITFVAAESGRRFDMNALALAENLVSHITIYLDKARLYRQSQELNADLEKRVSERTAELRDAITQLKVSEATIQSLFRISNKLNGTLDVGTILDELAQEAIRIVNGESGFAGLHTANEMTVRKYFKQGLIIPFDHTWAFGEGIPGWVLKNKIPYVTNNATNDPIMMHDLIINEDVQSIICTPILNSTGEVLGYFDIRNKQGGGGFTISDEAILMALAPSASIAIQNAAAYQRRLATVAELKESSRELQALTANMELVREEERTQIARELHDQLGQALTAMKFDLAWLRNRLVKTDAIIAQKAKTITQQMDAMIKNVRRIATELRPGMLDDLGLTDSIEWQAHDFEKRTGILCQLNIAAEDFHLDRTQSLAVFRIFQESLTNVARHASAKHIEVELAATSDALTLKIHDDGSGIKSHEVAGINSLGLLGMRERAKRLGGSFDIRRLPTDGTIVTVSIPLQNPSNLN